MEEITLGVAVLPTKAGKEESIHPLVVILPLGKGIGTLEGSTGGTLTRTGGEPSTGKYRNSILPHLIILWLNHGLSDAEDPDLYQGYPS